MRTSFLLFVSVLFMIGCEGDQGPTGPAGPDGIGGVSNVIDFLTPREVLRADGISSQDIKARITTTNGNNVVGESVTFKVVAGDGTLASNSAKTDFEGIATVRFNAGLESGETSVSAAFSNNGETASAQGMVYLDPLEVSPPLLSQEFKSSLHANWSPDGSTILFHLASLYDHGLFKVSAEGGEPQFIGPYRGGIWNPDGSGRIVAHNAKWEIFILDEMGEIVTGPIVPDAGFGWIRAIEWTSDGTRVIMTSNVNQYLVVMDLEGKILNRFSTPVDGNSLSAVPGSDQVVVSGGGSDWPSGTLLVDVTTQARTVLLDGTNPLGLNIFLGASVHPGGNSLLFSGRYQTSTQFEIFEMPINGGSPVAKLVTPVSEYNPRWSPDGNRILFSANRSGSGYNLFILDPTSTN